ILVQLYVIQTELHQKDEKTNLTLYPCLKCHTILYSFLIRAKRTVEIFRTDCTAASSRRASGCSGSSRSLIPFVAGGGRCTGIRVLQLLCSASVIK
ncbi:hypothetical protein LDENG_00299280, partial [Lucifuga dentata]